MFGLLRSHRLVLRERHDVDGGVVSLAFRPESPVGAVAGQHGLLVLGATAVKPFSLASAPEEQDVLIGTSLDSGSAFKKRLAALRPGDTAVLRGPVNTFTLHGQPTQVVLLAQGVGITPMRSMLAHIALRDLAVESSLVHVADAGHAFRSDTETWATRSAFPQRAREFRRLTVEATRATPDATFYLAGASSFVSSTAALLRLSSISRAAIRRDAYLGYRPQSARTTATTGHHRSSPQS